jgi:hypothetical protein
MKIGENRTSIVVRGCKPIFFLLLSSFFNVARERNSLVPRPFPRGSSDHLHLKGSCFSSFACAVLEFLLPFLRDALWLQYIFFKKRRLQYFFKKKEVAILHHAIAVAGQCIYFFFFLKDLDSAWCSHSWLHRDPCFA